MTECALQVSLIVRNGIHKAHNTVHITKSAEANDAKDSGVCTALEVQKAKCSIQKPVLEILFV